MDRPGLSEQQQHLYAIGAYSDDRCSTGCGALWCPGDEGWIICDSCNLAVCSSCIKYLELVVGEGAFHCPTCVGKIDHDAEAVELTKKKRRPPSKAERKRAKALERLRKREMKTAAESHGIRRTDIAWSARAPGNAQ